jgi:hypothetical protein
MSSGPRWATSTTTPTPGPRPINSSIGSSNSRRGSVMPRSRWAGWRRNSSASTFHRLLSRRSPAS